MVLRLVGLMEVEGKLGVAGLEVHRRLDWDLVMELEFRWRRLLAAKMRSGQLPSLRLEVSWRR